MKKIILGLMACAGLCACTDNDVVDNGSAQKVFEGDAAYIMVRINDVGTSTRATSTGFENGTSAEYAVTDPHFYFYDETGLLVGEGNKWDDGMAYDNNGNIDFQTDVILMLSGLTNKNYPAYIVTVLNKPSDFTPAIALSDLEGQLASGRDVGIIQTPATATSVATDFTMSTSSYGSGAYYYATAVTEDDFYLDPAPDANFEPVDIYVERLAAKVTVVSGLGDGDAALENGTPLYELDGVTFDEEEITPPLYVSLDGWKVNATARMSYMAKNINTSWTDTGLGFSWNDPTNFRSYWAMSPNYDVRIDGGYPESSNGNYPADEEDSDTQLNEYLRYVNLQDPNTIGADYYEYCGENTNTTNVISSKNSSGITSVLVKATLWEYDSESGTYVTPTVVRFNGVLFSEAAFLGYALSHQAATTTGLNVYYYAGDDTEGQPIYDQIDENYVELAEKVDGYVQVVLTADAKGMTWYSISQETVDGETVTVATAITVNDVQTILDEFNTYAYNEGNGGANGYLNGSMYYNVPIEHLNNTYAADGTLAEGNYGVVRNHHYYLTITDLVNIGKGIFDPDEVIIPDKDYDTYYIGAQINILSWKLVSQNVTL